MKLTSLMSPELGANARRRPTARLVIALAYLKSRSKALGKKIVKGTLHILGHDDEYNALVTLMKKKLGPHDHAVGARILRQYQTQVLDSCSKATQSRKGRICERRMAISTAPEEA